MTLNLNLPVQTRDGRKARIICRDAKGGWPVVALITTDTDKEQMHRYSTTGFVDDINLDAHPFDLINVPAPVRVKREGWVNVVTPDGYARPVLSDTIYLTDNLAKAALPTRTGSQRIEWEEDAK